MRLALLALLAALLPSTGCAAMVNSSGTDLDSLHTKAVVRDSLGTPIASGVIDGQAYEDFHTHRKISQKWQGEYFAIGYVITLGIGEVVWLPKVLYETSREMIAGHDLRFIYEADGTVKTILLDGNRHLGGGLCALPDKKPITPPEQAPSAISTTSASTSATNPP